MSEIENEPIEILDEYFTDTFEQVDLAKINFEFSELTKRLENYLRFTDERFCLVEKEEKLLAELIHLIVKRMHEIIDLVTDKNFLNYALMSIDFAASGPTFDKDVQEIWVKMEERLNNLGYERVMLGNPQPIIEKPTMQEKKANQALKH